MDSEAELSLLTKGLQAGIYSKEFVRQKLNAPIEDVLGQTYFFPTNLTSYEAGKEPPAPPEPAPVAPEQQQPPPAQQNSLLLSKLVERNLDRLITRVANGTKPALDHLPIWQETFSDFPNSDKLLQELGNLLDNATESRKVIAANINKELWTQKILNNDL